MKIGVKRKGTETIEWFGDAAETSPGKFVLPDAVTVLDGDSLVLQGDERELGLTDDYRGYSVALPPGVRYRSEGI